MRDHLVPLLQEIIDNTAVLMSQTDMEDLQHKFIEGMHSKAGEMLNLLISIPDFTWDRAKEVVSYESRSHLTSILGYAEELLEEPDSPLTANQRERVQQIHRRGRMLMHRLTEVLD
ncbi:MAG: hypothetical protein H7Y09_09570 [Chitinophagaceae bacterium]|nr:hypothetical protein [Anaerolineae bacterium]